jgi:hypothetical protein
MCFFKQSAMEQQRNASSEDYYAVMAANPERS